MCGICGSFSLDGRRAVLEPVLAMREGLSHRGPDDNGEYADGPAALGFARLSILDLEHGHQPMLTPSGDLALVFNGEIYNHPQLKTEFEQAGARYRTRSDTETILHAFQRRGRNALAGLRGMFALGLWDRNSNRLLLARDPIGIKPLYYAVQGRTLFFSSEMRALLRAGVSAEIDPVGLWDCLSFGYAHSPRTVLQNIRKLEPGQWLEADAQGIRTGRFCEFPHPAVEAMTVEECEIRLRQLLEASVRSHLLSDVPVGVFLSGGVDSGLVTALAARHGPVQTFSIGFDGARPGIDESKYARRIAHILGTQHHELRLPSDVLNRLEEAILALDEPLGDSAVLPTYLLSRYARREVKVVLTGEGADELFAGYGRYKATYFIHRTAALPKPLQRLALQGLYFFRHGSVLKRMPQDGIKTWVEACRASPAANILKWMTPEFASGAKTGEPPEWLRPLDLPEGFAGVTAHDIRTILPDALLMKVDKASMRASLEARVPYLDMDLVEFALRVPPELKIRLFKSKWILRRLAAKFLPASLAYRPKHGFWVPWEEWIRSPNPAVDEALSGLESTGLFHGDLIRRGLSELRAGSSAPDASLLFRLAVFALWYGALRRSVLSR